MSKSFELCNAASFCGAGAWMTMGTPIDGTEWCSCKKCIFDVGSPNGSYEEPRTPNPLFPNTYEVPVTPLASAWANRRRLFC